MYIMHSAGLMKSYQTLKRIHVYYALCRSYEEQSNFEGESMYIMHSAGLMKSYQTFSSVFFFSWVKYSYFFIH